LLNLLDSCLRSGSPDYGSGDSQGILSVHVNTQKTAKYDERQLKMTKDSEDNKTQ